MNKLIIVLLIALNYTLSAQTTEKTRILYGKCTTDSLRSEPFIQWYDPNYNQYHPAAEQVSSLRRIDLKNVSIKIFFGTWCGDSKREVPRFMKLLSSISFPESKIHLIGLGGSDSLLKQSPQHEEAGLGIFRVPTIIIYKDGKELNRINEFPAVSLEKDLLAILSGNSYSPNYRTFSLITKWLGDGTLSDENTTARGLAEQLRMLVSGEYEMNSLGYLLLKQGKKKEAVKIFQVNHFLYPESANTASSLGEGYYEFGEYKKAITALEKSLELNKDPKLLKEILLLLCKAKERV